MDTVLGPFLEEKGLFFVGRIGRGHSAQIFLVKRPNGLNLVVKQERPDSTRFRMVEREAENLAMANSVGVGPMLFEAIPEKRIILMEHVPGETFDKWLFSGPGKNQLDGFARELLRQANALDEIGLDHGQLAGRGRNILVKNQGGKAVPVIIDFEKASTGRKCHNLATLESFLFRNPNSAVSKKVRAVLEI